MELIVVLVFGFIVISLFASPVLAYIAIQRTRKLETEIAVLKARMNAFTIVETVKGAPVRPEAPPSAKPSAAPVSKSSVPPSGPHSSVPSPKRPVAIESETQPSRKTPSIEETLASRWLVILGGITISLGAAFLVKYSIEHSLISPALRLFFGGLLGASLIVGGEWVRRRPVQKAIASLRPDYVPSALTGAGIIAAFGSIYAGYAVYDLIAPIVVFSLLSAIAMGALALSLLQGPFIAALGLLGAFTIPLLVASDAPSAWALFSYLTIVAASAFAVLRYRDWWWLGNLTIVGSAIWQLIWLSKTFQSGDITALTAHAFALIALSFIFRYERIIDGAKNINHPFEFSKMNSVEHLILFASAAVSFLIFALIRADSYSWFSLSGGALLSVLLLIASLRLKNLESLVLLAASFWVTLLALWHKPDLVHLPEIFIHQGSELMTFPAPIVPPEFMQFTLVAFTISVAFGVVGYIGLWRSKQPDLWAAISCVTPLLALIICYWRMGHVGVDLAWATVATSCAVFALIAATKIGRNRSNHGMEAALGVYALIVLSAITLAATMTLDKAWLTMALAIQLPVIAWIYVKLKIEYLRTVAFLIAGIVGVRLLFLHHLPGSALHTQLDAGWILYSFGLPALAFGVAAKLFTKSTDDRLVDILESGAIAIGISLVSMEIRYFFGDGTLGFPKYNLLEQSLHSVAWFATGYGLYRRHRQSPRFMSFWGSKILIGLATAQVLIMQLFLYNPILTGFNVGTWPLVNILALAYVAPAVFAVLIAFEAKRQNHIWIAKMAGGAAFVLIFAYISLEVRHVFQGGNLKYGSISNAEGYAYSAVWLVYAGFLLANGIFWKASALRHASLGMLLLVVAKVFLWDMSALDGLYRAVSFLGLGLSLVGVGFLYQRFLPQAGIQE